MGRKSKLKDVRRRAAAAAAAASKMNNTNNQETLVTESVADAKETEEFINSCKRFGCDEKSPTIRDFEEELRNAKEERKKIVEKLEEAQQKRKDALRNEEYCENQRSELGIEADADRLFLKSDYYVQETQLSEVNSSIIYFSANNNDDTRIKKWMHSAVEDGCIHSMSVVASCFIRKEINGGRDNFHLAVPWCLEGSIRGSIQCLSTLEVIYLKAKPHKPEALIVYWGKMKNKYTEWNGSLDTAKQFKSKNAKLMKDNAEKACVICNKVDTDTLTLRQCSGCSMYCYCSDVCQTIQWERNHRSECKQIQILNKYHKPYAKEIRKATIRGENHPALKNLRSKLGLSRPIEDYQEFSDDYTHNGKLIDPDEYVVGREDGTVWIGSTPSPIGPFSNTTITTTSREDDKSSDTTPTKGDRSGNVSTASGKDDESGNVSAALAKDTQSSKPTFGFSSALPLPSALPSVSASTPSSRPVSAMVAASASALALASASLPVGKSTAGPCFGDSSSSLGVFGLAVAALKVSSDTTYDTVQSTDFSLPVVFGSSTQTSLPTGGSGGDVSDGSDNGTLAESDDDGPIGISNL